MISKVKYGKMPNLNMNSRNILRKMDSKLKRENDI